MNQEPERIEGKPPGALHEKLKQRDAGKFSADGDSASASESEEWHEDSGGVLDGRPEYPGGDTEEKLARGGGGDETGIDR
jgi:hypothetical protein